jgi:hypothetical protein
MSKPLSKANRAATWLAAISKATSNRLAKPCKLKALEEFTAKQSYGIKAAVTEGNTSEIKDWL